MNSYDDVVKFDLEDGIFRLESSNILSKKNLVSVIDKIGEKSAKVNNSNTRLKDLNLL